MHSVTLLSYSLPYPSYPHSVVPVTKGHQCKAHLLVSSTSSSHPSRIAYHSVSVTSHTVYPCSPLSTPVTVYANLGRRGLPLARGAYEISKSAKFLARFQILRWDFANLRPSCRDLRPTSRDFGFHCHF